MCIRDSAELTAEVEWFMEQFKLAKHRQFGASSERTDSSEQQLFLFNEAEKESSPGQAEPALEAITYNRRKKKGHREAMLKELPEEIIAVSYTHLLVNLLKTMQPILYSMLKPKFLLRLPNYSVNLSIVGTLYME